MFILTSFGTSADLLKAVISGATGAFLKDSPNDELLDAVRRSANVVDEKRMKSKNNRILWMLGDDELQASPGSPCVLEHIFLGRLDQRGEMRCAALEYDRLGVECMYKRNGTRAQGLRLDVEQATSLGVPGEIVVLKPPEIVGAIAS